MERDIRQDKEIKEFALQEELMSLPSLVWYYHAEYQNMKSRVQELKAKYEYVQQKAFLRILAEKTEEEGKKPTDKVLTALVSQDAQVVTTYKEYLDAERRKNELQVCTQVIDCKISSIKQMVELRKTEYFNTDNTVETIALKDNTTKAQAIRKNFER